MTNSRSKIETRLKNTVDRLDKLYDYAERGYRTDNDWHEEVRELRAQYKLLKEL